MKAFGTALLLLVALLLVGNTKGAPLPCGDPEPEDEFSAKIEALLDAVEGPEYPDNVGSWQQRASEIEASFAEILALTQDDLSRRKAAVQTLIGAEVLTADPSESSMFSQGPERGEVRAWVRHALKRYASMGVTSQDLRYADAGLIGDLQTLWANEALPHPQRDLPFYQEKAKALRELARFRQLPSCE